MKKLTTYFAFLVVAAFALVACDENYDDWADPQTNAQESLVDINFQVTVTANSIEIGDITTDSVALARITSTSELEEGATVSYEAQLFDSEDFSSLQEVLLSYSADACNAAVADLQAAVVELFGKRPDARTVYMRLVSYINVNGQIISKASNTVTLTITPEAPVIDTAYYMIGTVNNWNDTDVSTLLKFAHSGKDVYEDPYFTLIFEASGEAWWKLIPQSTVDAVQAGSISNVWEGTSLGVQTDGDDSLEGTLTLDNPQAGKIEATGWVKMTLNMMEGTYTIEVIGEMPLQLYVNGGYCGWDFSEAKTVYSQYYDFTYDGYINIDNGGFEFKFATERAWDSGTNYGVGDDVNLVTDGGNIAVAENGFYRLTVDLNSMTYSATKTEWGLIGDATPGGWDGSTTMTQNGYVWSVTAQLSAGEFKFRANDAWDVNLGGDLDNLTYGGDNITLTEAGTYAVTLDLSDPTVYKATVVKQ